LKQKPAPETKIKQPAANKPTNRTHPKNATDNRAYSQPIPAKWLLIWGVAALAAYLGWLQWRDSGSVQAASNQPYVLPTFSESPGDFRDIRLGDSLDVDYEMDRVFDLIIKCYPVDSNHAESVNLRANTEVAGIPIRPDRDVFRTMRQEQQIRHTIIENISAFFSALALERLAQRKLSMAESLEKRSQVRVGRGLAPTAEQIDFMAKSAAAVTELAERRIALSTARLSLVSSCRDSERGGVNQHLVELIYGQNKLVRSN